MDLARRLQSVRQAREQLGVFRALGYISGWHYDEVGGVWTVSTANGGYYMDLDLQQVRLLLAGLAIGAQGRETSVHLTAFDFGVLFTALSNQETLQRHSEESLASINRLKGYFGTHEGFE